MIDNFVTGLVFFLIEKIAPFILILTSAFIVIFGIFMTGLGVRMLIIIGGFYFLVLLFGAVIIILSRKLKTPLFLSIWILLVSFSFSALIYYF